MWLAILRQEVTVLTLFALSLHEKRRVICRHTRGLLICRHTRGLAVDLVTADTLRKV